ncbi:MAG TPA: SIMPL domain-containing protein [Sphingomicrobium sp.]|nr:SIMPL domain-containing protein [Sphingomicrobium sp.]
MFRCVALAFLFVGVSASAQPIAASIDQLAATPLVTVEISEQLRAPPDEATLTAGTESRAPTAAAALAANKVKTEQLLAGIKSAGIAGKDIQTEGVSVAADYEFETVNGRGTQHLVGYAARNTVRIKTRQIERLVSLLDTLTAAGATNIYGPSFTIADPAPLRAEARKRAMARGAVEASEYARNAGFRDVQLLSVQEGVSYRATDIVVNARGLPAVIAAPAPPPPPPGGGIEPGQIETGVTLTLNYRMVR